MGLCKKSLAEKLSSQFEQLREEVGPYRYDIWQAARRQSVPCPMVEFGVAHNPCFFDGTGPAYFEVQQTLPNPLQPEFLPVARTPLPEVNIIYEKCLPKVKGYTIDEHIVVNQFGVEREFNLRARYLPTEYKPGSVNEVFAGTLASLTTNALLHEERITMSAARLVVSDKAELLTLDMDPVEQVTSFISTTAEITLDPTSVVNPVFHMINSVVSKDTKNYTGLFFMKALDVPEAELRAWVNQAIQEKVRHYYEIIACVLEQIPLEKLVHISGKLEEQIRVFRQSSSDKRRLVA